MMIYPFQYPCTRTNLRVLLLYDMILPNGDDIYPSTNRFSLKNSSTERIIATLLLILIIIFFYSFRKKLKQKDKEITCIRNLLTNEEEHLRIVLSSIGEGVIISDLDGKVIFINDTARKITGWTNESAIGMSITEVFDITDRYSQQRTSDLIKRILTTGEKIESSDQIILKIKDGTERSIAYDAAPIRNNQEHILGIVWVFCDITEKLAKIKEIEYLGFHDELTGLGNRRYLEAKLNQFNQEAYLPLAVIIGDANGLKLVNDAFGHFIGDKLLIKIAEEIKSACRSDDHIFRYGGDEFIVLLPNTSETEAEKISKRIHQACSEIQIGSVKFSMSLGWAVKKSLDDNLMEIIMVAENFMYKRKQDDRTDLKGNVVQKIMNALELNVEGEKLHSEHVSEMCEKLAGELNLDTEDREKCKKAGKYHDIGKSIIDKAILDKSEPLSAEEWHLIKQHSENGYRLLSIDPNYRDIAEYVLQHHERWDGKGYPKGLKGEEIQYISRIIAICDSYDAMTSNRPYRRALSDEEAIKEIIDRSGSQFDPNIAKVFIEKVLRRSWN